MTEEDAQIRAFFDAATSALPDAGFTAGVMQRLERQAREAHVFTLAESCAALSLLLASGYFLESRWSLWSHASRLPELFAQHPWWLAGVVVAVCLVPLRPLTGAA